MSLGPLLTDVVVTFCLAAGILYHYGNCMRHHIVVTIAVLIAWYFSFLIVFVLPLDVSSTVYRQCIGENGTIVNQTELECKKPWSHVPDNVFPNLWRVVYWTSQCLTWLIMPVMQSYSRAGEFTWKGKIKSAIIDNTIYYGTYLFICGILLIYLALQPDMELDGQKLKAIASSASNTWGLFLLVLLLGYALVEVPRSLWNASKKGYLLHYAYFHAAKLSCDKCEAQDAVDDVLETLKALSAAVRSNHPQYRNLETILQKVPIEMRERMNRRPASDDSTLEPPTEKSLIRLHKQVIKALQTQHRTETQWDMLVKKIFLLEDVAKNQVSHDHRFKWSFPPQRSPILQAVFTPTVEWYWRCLLHSYVLKIGAIICSILSIFVVWSEVTFFNKEPVLSLFANFLNLAKADYDYFTIEVLSTLIIAYLCFCAYSTVLKIRVLNHYYIAPHHQTDEFSLIFSGMMLCRLTPPMCLNFLGLIHMDSHIIKKRILETHYTQVMGHMDVIAIISDGFNIYFPMLMLAFCLATYFSLGSRALSMLGFQQFVGDDELTGELVDEGRELIKRERRRLERNEESMNRRREFQERFGANSASRYRPTARSGNDPEHGEMTYLLPPSDETLGYITGR
ncbi:LMBR1 domain-containing protein 2 homolog isoform X2 [Frankliniella occidentalis]|uniref:LMBR1 domain-containing protein 2 homolog isoform X2 n=1 Tax=Frankliniella occidentalis TaxID=133901 RepID=A0A6J1TDH7_FRAOC|nr:LMBR1 domain-containing protein 2 homolog isoform X2 [Frankliniella occidentalis]